MEYASVFPSELPQVPVFAATFKLSPLSFLAVPFFAVSVKISFISEHVPSEKTFEGCLAFSKMVFPFGATIFFMNLEGV